MAQKQKYLVIHCTATKAGREVTAAEIRRWHTSPPPVGRGWKQVGYTDLFHLDGSVERLVKNNEDIVYAGGCGADGKTPQDTRTEAQKAALKRYVLDFHEKHPKVLIVGHHQLNKAKACPSFDVAAWLKEIGIKQ